MSVNCPTKPLQIIPWQKVYEWLPKAHPLHLLIKNLSLQPHEHYPLILARYSFGDSIISNGKWKEPPNASSIDHHFLNKTRNLLNYHSIPVGILLNRCAERYFLQPKRIVPYQLLQIGSLFGFPNDSITTQFYGELCAGARSLFLLPKTNERLGINRLKNYFRLPRNFHLATPQSFWNFLRFIKSWPPISSWDCDVLFFTQPWFSPGTERTNTQPWQDFYRYIRKETYNLANKRMPFIENNPIFYNLLYHFDQKNLKISPYELATIKHLISIAQANLPGFRPIEDDSVAPVKAIETIFLQIYRLKYWPALLAPESLSQTQDLAYYSLTCPSLLESPPFSEMLHAYNQLCRLKKLMGSLSNSNTFSSFKPNQWNFFHFQPNKTEGIQSTQRIPIIDSRFTIRPKYFNYQFCATGYFLRSCIAIRR